MTDPDTHLQIALEMAPKVWFSEYPIACYIEDSSTYFCIPSQSLVHPQAWATPSPRQCPSTVTSRSRPSLAPKCLPRLPHLPLLAAPRAQARREHLIRHLRGLLGRTGRVRPDRRRSEQRSLVAATGGEVEAMPDADARAMFETNFWGASAGRRCASSETSTRREPEGGCQIHLDRRGARNARACTLHRDEVWYVGLRVADGR